ncbi:MAG: MgtC/SapB family protein, partial [Rhodospirillales bacterium]
GNFSATSAVAGLLTFALGAYAMLGELRVAVAAAVAMTVLLALREPLHRWVASLHWVEIRAVLILLAMTFLLLPVLPNRAVDPWQALNPSEIWLLAILIAAISFAGYVAVRLFGDRLGVLMTGLAGGLASSTAATLTLARLARAHPGSSRLLAGGILAAGVVMVLRVGAVAAALNPAMRDALALPLGAAAVALAAGAALCLLGARDDEHPSLAIANPLELGTALKLAAFIAAVTVAAKLASDAGSGHGVLLVAAASGLADVDAVTISMARLGGAGIDIDLAVAAIAVAVAVNTTAKAAMAAWTGGAAVGAYVGAASAVALAAGAAAHAATA